MHSDVEVIGCVYMTRDNDILPLFVTRMNSIISISFSGERCMEHVRLCVRVCVVVGIGSFGGGGGLVIDTTWNSCKYGCLR